MSRVDVDGWPGLSYGETERLLASMQGVAPEAIRTRFRKLRLRPFPGEIRSGVGVRVVYDLPRVLALAAVFELNRLFVPQGHAVDMVERNWPEWARAFIAAASCLEIVGRSPQMPTDARSVVHLRPDAYADVFGPCDVRDGDGGVHGVEARLPGISVDVERTVAALVTLPGVDRQRLGRAFTSLELAFGWTPPSRRHRGLVVDMVRGGSFLDEGPFFDRAERLLTAFPPADSAGAMHPGRRAEMVALLRYLEAPAPIDGWKADVGDDDAKPRLGQLISFWASANGLPSTVEYPATFESVEVRDARELALERIAVVRDTLGRV